MGANGKPVSPASADSNLFNDNFSKIPLDELAPHFGRVAAVSLDGTRILFSGDYYDDLFAKAEAAGLKPEEFVSCYVPDPDGLS
jgi:hypothetical protein